MRKPILMGLFLHVAIGYTLTAHVTDSLDGAAYNFLHGFQASVDVLHDRLFLRFCDNDLHGLSPSRNDKLPESTASAELGEQIGIGKLERYTIKPVGDNGLPGDGVVLPGPHIRAFHYIIFIS